MKKYEWMLIILIINYFSFWFLIKRNYPNQTLLSRPDKLEYRPDKLKYRPDKLEYRPDKLEYRPDKLEYPLHFWETAYKGWKSHPYLSKNVSRVTTILLIRNKNAKKNIELSCFDLSIDIGLYTLQGEAESSRIGKRF